MLADPQVAVARPRIDITVPADESAPAASSSAAAAATATAILETVGISAEFDNAQFAGMEGDQQVLQFYLRTDEQRKRLFKAKKQLMGRSGGRRRVGRLNNFLTDQQRAQRLLLRASPAFKAAEAAQLRVRDEGGKWRVLWLPDGCVIGLDYWTADYARALDAERG